MRVYIGADHGGYHLKALVVEHCKKLGHEPIDLGTDSLDSCDYPVFADKVCEAVVNEKRLGILICGTGIGMSMTANKRNGIRAAVCTNEYMARLTRLHNDANVLCMGERVVGAGLALDMVEAFLSTEFEGGRHQRRIELMQKPPVD